MTVAHARRQDHARAHRHQPGHHARQARDPRHGIPVELVLRKLGAGMTVDEIIADHPRLTADDVRAAQAFAADYLADDEIVYG